MKKRDLYIWSCMLHAIFFPFTWAGAILYTSEKLAVAALILVCTGMLSLIKLALLDQK